MSVHKKKIPLIVILGPTAVGKTDLSIALAKEIQGEIISADSRLVYRGMDIGTAKPSKVEISQIPHHLIDIISPDDPWSLADYQEQVFALITEIDRKGNIPIMVGGTGQYIQAVVEGWEIPKKEADPNLRRILESWGEEIGTEEMHSRLAYIDPQAASRMDKNNLRRIVRALEVIFSTGKKFSNQQKKKDPGYRVVRIGLIRTREELYARIDQRIDSMFAKGFEEEVKGLIDQGYSPDLPSMSAIGYKQVAQYLAGEITKAEAVQLMRRLTRQFVRRQANWFKLEDPLIEWFNLEEVELAAIIGFVKNCLVQETE